jgi:hypothetical protein
MSPLDLSRLSGPDGAVALRSFARRYRAAILPTDDPDVEELAYHVGPDGHSALDHVVAATATFVLIGQALRQTLSGQRPVLHPGVVDDAEREWSVPPGTSIASALERLEDEAKDLAGAIDPVELTAWNHTAQVAGGATVTAYELVREAVRAGAEHLRAATADIDAARAR